MLGAWGLIAGRDLYRATLAVTRDLGFSGLIRRIASFSHLLRHAWGCGGSILTQILTGQIFMFIVNVDLLDVYVDCQMYMLTFQMFMLTVRCLC
jgi:hypothetical protein